jgi:hypothetical protein
MGRFTIHFMAHRAIGSPVNIYINEEKVAVYFRLHGEQNVLVDTVHVVRVTRWRKCRTRNGTNKGVICNPVERHPWKFSAKLALTRNYGRPTATPSICSQNWPAKLKCGADRTGRKSFRISSSKCRVSRLMVSLSYTLVKSDATSKLTIIFCCPVHKEPSVRRKSVEFFTWCRELPVWEPIGPPGVWSSNEWGSQWCSQ